MGCFNFFNISNYFLGIYLHFNIFLHNFLVIVTDKNRHTENVMHKENGYDLEYIDGEYIANDEVEHL